MKSWTGCMLLASLIALGGCAEERIPPDDADAWEISTPDNAAPETGSNEQKETIAAETDSEAPASSQVSKADDVVASLKGSAFKVDGTTQTRESSGDVFRASHYFQASAPVEFDTTVTLVETTIEGQNRDGAVPLIGFKIVSTEGKYRAFSTNERPVDGKQNLKDQYEIGPGKYKVTMTYYKDTVGEKRPTITLHEITFRE